MDTPERTPQGEPPRKRGPLEQIAKYSELALVLPAGAVGGWVVGAFLDRYFGTHWIYLLGLVLGFIGGFVHVIRVAVAGSRE
ncbi:MAG TPA: AtpZ/AtpI family protein [Clostridia bacterium]|nr:AtpZ/AtpI family protein [Clostridia bacterium]